MRDFITRIVEETRDNVLSNNNLINKYLKEFEDSMTPRMLNSSNSATANVRQESEVQANDVLLADMTLLCKLCAEYSSNKTNIFLTESEKENAKKYEHYAWVVKRATIKLGILEDRQIEIKKLIFSK